MTGNTYSKLKQTLKSFYVAILPWTTWGRIDDTRVTDNPVVMTRDGLAHLGKPLCPTRATLCCVLCQKLAHGPSSDMLPLRGQKWYFYIEWLYTCQYDCFTSKQQMTEQMEDQLFLEKKQSILPDLKEYLQ